MKFINSFFKNRHTSLSTSFSQSVDKIINCINNENTELNDDEFYQLIKENTCNGFEAKEIYIFLPIAFAQLWMPKAKWLEEFDEMSGKKIVTKRYDETKSFLMIKNEVVKYFEIAPKANTIYQIAGRSSEINAINKLLLEYKDKNIEDINFTKTVVIK